ncbi:MAG: carbon storage regulator [Oscillospiraceae bacterium]|jgi:carbon storage regulator|nr:carbon storage regulator [Oscillospiraceae bacterium]
MLVVTRKTEEGLVIADNVEVTVLEISKDRVKIGISAPKEMKIMRSELVKTQEENIESAKSAYRAAVNSLLKNVGKK